MYRLCLIALAVLLLTGCAKAPTPVPPTLVPAQQVAVESTATAAPPTATLTATIAPCRVLAADFVIELKATFDEWDDANKLAQSTARVALADAVKDLQEIRRRVSALEPPECAKPVQSLCAAYMDSVIESYLAFMAQKPDSEVQKLVAMSEEALITFADALAELETGVKPPTRTATTTPTITLTPTLTPTPAPGQARESAAFLNEPVRMTINDSGIDAALTLTALRVLRGKEAELYYQEAGGAKPVIPTIDEYVIVEWTLEYEKGPSGKEPLVVYPNQDHFLIYEDSWSIFGKPPHFAPDPFRKATKREMPLSLEVNPGESHSFWTIHQINKNTKDLYMKFECACGPCGYLGKFVAYFHLKDQ